MKQELSSRFYERWPKWFNRETPPVRGGFWGLECGDGWFDLLWELCEKLEPIVQDLDFQVQQVKEKFSGLRFYCTHSGLSEIEQLIAEAEDKSYKTCENCGKEGKPQRGGWIKVLCEECVAKR